MARKKVMINRDALIAAIEKVEGGDRPPRHRNELYIMVSQELESQGIKAPPGSVLGRINDYGLTVKTPIGKRGGFLRNPQDDNITSLPTEQVLDLSPFTGRGIEVNNLGDLLTSTYKSHEENKKIQAAWKEVRLNTNNPRPSSLTQKSETED